MRTLILLVILFSLPVASAVLSYWSFTGALGLLAFLALVFAEYFIRWIREMRGKKYPD